MSLLPVEDTKTPRVIGQHPNSTKNYTHPNVATNNSVMKDNAALQSAHADFNHAATSYQQQPAQPAVQHAKQHFQQQIEPAYSHPINENK